MTVIICEYDGSVSASVAGQVSSEDSDGSGQRAVLHRPIRLRPRKPGRARLQGIVIFFGTKTLIKDAI